MPDALRLALRDQRWVTIWWSIGLGVYGLLMGATYTLFKGQTELDDLFGDQASGFAGGVDSFTSLGGYIDSQILALIPVIAGIYAITAGTRMLAGDEEAGRMDLWLTTPVSRVTLAWTRFFGLAFTLVVAITVTGAAIVLGLVLTGETTDLAWVFLDTLDAIPATLFVAAVAFFLGAWFHTRRIAALIATLWLVMSYLLVGIASLATELDPLKWISLLHYYNQSKLISGTLDPTYYAIAVVGAALLVAIGLLRFDRKDLYA